MNACGLALIRTALVWIGSTVAASAPAAQNGWSERARLTPNGFFFATAEFSPTGDFAAIRASDGSAYSLFMAGVGSAPTQVLGATFTSLGPLSIEFTSDGEYVVFDGSLRAIYSVDVDTPGVAVRLSAPLVGGGSVSRRYVSPDGARVVYVADQDVDKVYELYSVPIDGSAAPVKLSGSLVSGGDVTEVAFSPDGATVVYIADQDVDEQFELYRVPADGSSGATRLNIGGAGQDVREAQVTADGANVVVHITSGVYALALTPGALPVYLGPSPGSGSVVLSPNGAFAAWHDSTTLYASPVSGGPPVVLNGGADTLSTPYFTPDSTRVIWQETVNGAGNTGTQTIWSAPVGGGRVALASDAWSGSPYYYAFKLSGDSAYVVYELDPQFEIWSAPVGGGTSVALTPTVAGRVSNLQTADDGSTGDYAFFIESDAMGGDGRLFRVAMDGGAAPELVAGPVLPLEGLDTRFEVTPDGRHVAFEVDDGIDRILYRSLRTVRLDGAAPQQGPAAGGTVVWLRGDGFSAETEVFFGVRKAATYLLDEQTLLALSPAIPVAATGRKLRRFGPVVDLLVRNVGTQSKLAGGFSYYR